MFSEEKLLIMLTTVYIIKINIFNNVTLSQPLHHLHDSLSLLRDFQPLHDSHSLLR